jgi:hypothetical protein
MIDILEMKTRVTATYIVLQKLYILSEEISYDEAK